MEPIAKGANPAGARCTATTTVRTKKNVPINSTKYLRIVSRFND